MSLSELLDELFRLYRNHFSLIAGVALIVVLPGLIWTLITGTYKLTGSSYTNVFTPGTAPNFSSSQFSNLFGLLALGGLGGLILLPFSVGAVYRAVTDVALGRTVTIGGVIRETLARYVPLLGLIALFFVFAIVWVIASVVGLILLVLPFFVVLAAAIFLLIRWSLTVAAMMAENIGPVAALQRSWNLVTGMWWRTLGILVVIGVLQAIINLALSTLLSVIVGVALSGDTQLAVAAIVSTLVTAVVSPVLTIGTVLLYFDLRVRKEGLDLDQLARQTSPGPAPA